MAKPFEAPSEEELFRFMADVDEDGSLGSQEKVGWWAVAPNCPCRGTCFYLPHNISPSDRDLDHVTSLNHLKRN